MNGRMASLKDRRWFNPTLPQMLQIAVFLLYFGAFFGLFDALDALRGAPFLLLVFTGPGICSLDRLRTRTPETGN